MNLCAMTMALPYGLCAAAHGILLHSETPIWEAFVLYCVSVNHVCVIFFVLFSKSFFSIS